MHGSSDPPLAQLSTVWAATLVVAVSSLDIFSFILPLTIAGGASLVFHENPRKPFSSDRSIGARWFHKNRAAKMQ